MIREDYCSRELMELLKRTSFKKDVHLGQGLTRDDDKGFYKTFHHALVTKWLRVVHHVEIYITFGFPHVNGKDAGFKYFWSIVMIKGNHLEYPMDDPQTSSYEEEMADSYPEAIEAAIKYTIENLL